ncbi:MAG: AraC family transcriptional regulator, partial [Ginsengibacter sp.]
MKNQSAPNIISFLSKHAIVDIHYHNCFQIVVSINSTFNCTIDKKEYQNRKGFIINQNIKHSCRAPGTSVLVYFIDAESYMGWQLKEMLNGKSFIDIETLISGDEMQELKDQINPESSTKEINLAANNLVEKIIPSGIYQKKKLTDERIINTLKYIDLHIDETITLEDISKQIFLSPERTRHLFVQQTGTPFSQYLLWKRIKNVIIAVVKNKTSLASACIHFGFTDQAHFSRIFKRMFGTSAIPLLKNSRYV